MRRKNFPEPFLGHLHCRSASFFIKCIFNNINDFALDPKNTSTIKGFLYCLSRKVLEYGHVIVIPRIFRYDFRMRYVDHIREKGVLHIFLTHSFILFIL